MNKKVILIALVVLAVALAGCVGDGGTAPEGDGGGDGTEDGAEDGDGGDGEDADGGMDEDGGDGDGDDGGGGTDDGSTGDGGEPGETTDDGSTDDGTGDGTDGGMMSTSLGDAFGMTQEFAFDAEVEGEQQATVSGRFHQGDMYMEFESEEGGGEFYMVGDSQYIVSSGQGEDFCMQNPDTTPPGENQVDPGNYESEVSEYSDLTPTDTDTIDGEEVYVYELDPDMTGQSETVTYYVGVDSGYLRRVETAESTVNFHSWNDVDPVEAPDMDCQDMGDMPSR